MIYEIKTRLLQKPGKKDRTISIVERVESLGKQKWNFAKLE